MKNILQFIVENPIFVRYQVFLMPILSFMISMILLTFLIIPQLLEFNGQNDRRKTLEVRKQLLQAKIETLSKVDLDVYKSNIATALIALPQEKDVPAAISQVLFLLSSNRMRLDEISLSGGDQVVDGVKAFQIRVDARGSEDSLKNFLESIKGSTRILSLDKLVVDGGSSSIELQATMDLTAYYEPLPAELGGVDQEIQLPTQSGLEILDKIKSTQVIGGEIDSNSVPLGKTDLFD